ncbi:MAG: hypothetical protein OXE94_01495 [Aestuariivita sp.]|nr:hypothetical protein [Aestuariivita sp.]MCY4202183.1 hypothetical protein [Aestuariivita sp.]
MGLPNLDSKPAPLRATGRRRNFLAVVWRRIKAQHVVSRLNIVDTPDEQHRLEDILDETKLPVPPAYTGLHYLNITPFRQ